MPTLDAVQLPEAPPEAASANQTVMVSGNEGPLSCLIALADGGEIWIGYAWNDQPAASIYLWHQGGATQPINPGWNNFQVGVGDCIQWTLASPSNMIKIAYLYP